MGRHVQDRWVSERDKGSRFKAGRELVTSMDLRLEEVLRKTIHRAFPEDSILGEELPDHVGQSLWTWVLDPIDGTSNFAHGIPFFSICVGLLRRGRAVAGIVHDPLRRETFSAWKGSGAFLGRQPLPLSSAGPMGSAGSRRRLSESLVAIHATPRTAPQKALRRLRVLLPKARTLRFFGSGSLELAYLAAGRIDAVVWHTELHRYLHDLAPGLPIIREAGRKVSIFDREESQRLSAGLVAAEAKLHDEIVGLLRSAAR
jgi:myo-inositol-1(or 4)-monophosphatase